MVSDGENGQSLIGATRRIDRDRSRLLPWPELDEPRRERAGVGERERLRRESVARERERAEVKNLIFTKFFEIFTVLPLKVFCP